MIIYKTINLINNKIYIGQDIKNNPKYLGSGKLLKLAIKKYGKENFIKEKIIECVSIEELDRMEIFYINKFNSTDKKIGYNICEGGRSYRTMRGENNPRYGIRLTDEDRKKISEATKKSMTPEVCDKIKKSRKYQVFSKETRKIWSDNRKGEKNPNFGKRGELNHNYGKKHSDETRLKISESNKGKKNSMYGKSGNLNPDATRYYIETPEGDIVILDGRKLVMDFLGCSIGFFSVKKYKKYKLVKKEKINR
jgi:group I intron endonuclease